MENDEKRIITYIPLRNRNKGSRGGTGQGVVWRDLFRERVDKTPQRLEDLNSENPNLQLLRILLSSAKPIRTRISELFK